MSTRGPIRHGKWTQVFVCRAFLLSCKAVCTFKGWCRKCCFLKTRWSDFTQMSQGYVSLSSYELSRIISSCLGDKWQGEAHLFGRLPVSDGWSMTTGRLVGIEWWEEHKELVGLSWMAVVSCSVCSLVSSSNVDPPILIKPQWSGLVLAWEEWAEGRRLNMQHAPKNENATSRSKGPMMIGGLFEGSILAKPKAPTRVMLIPASMTQSPQAQHRAGDGWLGGRRGRIFFTAAGRASWSEQIILPVESRHFLSTSFSSYLVRETQGSGIDGDD